MANATPYQIARDLNGISTDVSIQRFRDSVLILISQVGKVGNLIQVTVPVTTPLSPAPPLDPAEPNAQRLPPIPTGIQLTNLLGYAPSEHTHILHNLYASQTATLVWTSEPDPAAPRKNVVVGIALRKTQSEEVSATPTPVEKETFSGVMSMVQEILAKGE